MEENQNQEQVEDHTDDTNRNALGSGLNNLLIGMLWGQA